MLMALVSARPTYGYRRITALLNRQMRRDGNEPINHKRVYRIMQANHLLPARKYAVRPDYGHEGKVVTMRSTCAGARMASSSTAGMARSCAALSSSMHMTGRSSAGAL
jgi:hypothetical protein